MKQKLIVFAGPSGSGKSTLANIAMNVFDELEFSVSATTRQPRANEKDGVDYYYLSRDEFEKRIGENAFIEHEEVYDGLYYGTLISELERIWNDNQIPVLDIDVKGAVQLKNKTKELGVETLYIFIHPGSVDILKERLEKRSTETPDAIKMRLKRAVEELEYTHEFDRVIYNEDLEESRREVIEDVRSFIS